MMRAASILLVFFFAYAPLFVNAGAQPVVVSPAVVDLKGKPRDILQETIRLTNTTDHMVELYPRVDNTNATSGAETFTPVSGAQDLVASLANWIDLSRGVIDLAPGDVKDVPFVVSIDAGALAGTYHARVAFFMGGTRDEAEAHDPAVAVSVNLDVEADVKEIMQVNSFATDNVVFTGDDVIFKYQLQNIGNQDEQPAGEIRIYDRAGHEVASVDVNRDGKTISPDQTSQLASVWSAVQGFGKFKAMLTVKYGRGQTATVQDIAYLWVVPWKQLALALSVTIVAIIVLALYFHRRLEERHFAKLAQQGLLNADAMTRLPHSQPIAAAPVATVAPIKKRKKWFSRREPPAPIAASAPVPLPATAPASASAQKQRSIRDSIPHSAIRAPHAGLGGTIDLKKMGVKHGEEWHVDHARSAESEHGPVINLKGS